MTASDTAHRSFLRRPSEQDRRHEQHLRTASKPTEGRQGVVAPECSVVNPKDLAGLSVRGALRFEQGRAASGVNGGTYFNERNSMNRRPSVIERPGFSLGFALGFSGIGGYNVAEGDTGKVIASALAMLIFGFVALIQHQRALDQIMSTRRPAGKDALRPGALVEFDMPQPEFQRFRVLNIGHGYDKTITVQLQDQISWDINHRIGRNR